MQGSECVHAIISPEREQLMLRAPVDLVVRVCMCVHMCVVCKSVWCVFVCAFHSCVCPTYRPQDMHTRKGIDVEIWMLALERQMQFAMRETLKAALESLPTQV